MRCWSTPRGTPDVGIRIVAEDASRFEPDAFTPATGFDPRGPDATAEAHWTVDGQAATSGTCTALGIADIRIAFEDEASWYEHPDLVAPCSTGHMDTRPTPVILSGTWTVQVQALDATGAIIARGTMASLNVTPGSHLIMDPIDFSGGAFKP